MLRCDSYPKLCSKRKGCLSSCRSLPSGTSNILVYQSCQMYNQFSTGSARIGKTRLRLISNIALINHCSNSTLSGYNLLHSSRMIDKNDRPTFLDILQELDAFKDYTLPSLSSEMWTWRFTIPRPYVLSKFSFLQKIHLTCRSDNAENFLHNKAFSSVSICVSPVYPPTRPNR